MRPAIIAAVLGIFLATESFAQTGAMKVLIIGNAHYAYLDPLDPQTINDANKVASALEANGIDSSDVTLKFDLDKKHLADAIEEFSRGLKPNDVAIFYFSGHGFSIDRDGYLAPIDMPVIDVDTTTKAEARDQGYPLAQLFDYLAKANLRVAILDACRNDPHLDKRVTKDSSTLFQVRPLTAEVPPVGTVVAFATSAGDTAELNSPDNLSFYTHYLAASLASRPGTLLEALQKTKADVIQASNQHQVPAIYDESSAPIVLSAVDPGPDTPGPTPGGGEGGGTVPPDKLEAFNRCVAKKIDSCMTSCFKFVAMMHYSGSQWNCAQHACVYDDRHLTGLSKTEKNMQPGTNYYLWTQQCKLSTE